MKCPRTVLLVLLLTACGQAGSDRDEEAGPPPKFDSSVRSEFLRLAAGDPWARWPDSLEENPADDGQPCKRVTDEFREEAIARLAQNAAVAIDHGEYRRITGAAPRATGDKLYLLRGFSTTKSAARVKVTGNAVTVHSDALGGLFNLRRHPCIAVLNSVPSQVYTVAAYDL